MGKIKACSLRDRSSGNVGEGTRWLVERQEPHSEFAGLIIGNLQLPHNYKAGVSCMYKGVTITHRHRLQIKITFFDEDQNKDNYFLIGYVNLYL